MTSVLPSTSLRCRDTKRRPDVHPAEAEPEPGRPLVLDPWVVGVIDEGLGDVESEGDVGVDGDRFVAPLDLGQRLRVGSRG